MIFSFTHKSRFTCIDTVFSFIISFSISMMSPPINLYAKEYYIPLPDVAGLLEEDHEVMLIEVIKSHRLNNCESASCPCS